MKGDDFRLVVEAINVSIDALKEDVFAAVDRKIESYRKAMWVRDTWCCEAMTRFAAHFWCAPRPKRDYEFGTTLQIRGEVVNYCPFCGVFVGREKARDA